MTEVQDKYDEHLHIAKGVQMGLYPDCYNTNATCQVQHSNTAQVVDESRDFVHDAASSSVFAFFAVWMTGTVCPRTPESAPPSGSTARLRFSPVWLSSPAAAVLSF
jgi:hypothetical protein